MDAINILPLQTAVVEVVAVALATGVGVGVGVTPPPPTAIQLATPAAVILKSKPVIQGEVTKGFVPFITQADEFEASFPQLLKPVGHLTHIQGLAVVGVLTPPALGLAAI